ncbi:MAG: putative RND superfamily exporter protein, partial [Gammaproteobacteria bacterium]
MPAPNEVPPAITSGAVATYAAAVIRFRWLVLLVVVGACLVTISGVRFLEVQADYRYHFTTENPEFVAFNNLEDTYTKLDNILFVLAPQSGNVFQRESIEAVSWLTEQGWQIPYSIRVDSLSNFQHTSANGDDLSVTNLVDSDFDFAASELQRVRQIALAEPMLVGKLVAANEAVTAVSVTVRIPERGGVEGEAALYAHELADQLRIRYPAIKIAVTGSIPLIYAMMETPQRDAMTLVPIMYLVLAIAMLLFLRSLWGVLALLLMVGLAAATAMGAAGWLGIPLSPPMGSATTIILTIAVADGVHILVSYAGYMRKGLDRHAAMIESLTVNWQPVLLTTITTIIGFMSLNFAGIPPFHDLGNVSAIGVGAAWVL